MCWSEQKWSVNGSKRQQHACACGCCQHRTVRASRFLTAAAVFTRHILDDTLCSHRTRQIDDATVTLRCAPRTAQTHKTPTNDHSGQLRGKCHMTDRNKKRERSAYGPFAAFANSSAS